jgi:hypothetical protein
VISVDPEAAERRRKQAERNARVELTGEPEGTASLFGRSLPAAQAAAAWARVSAIAKALEKGGAAGGIDLLRAQVFIRLLLVPPGAPEPPDDATDPAGPSGGDSPSSPGDPGSSAAIRPRALMTLARLAEVPSRALVVLAHLAGVPLALRPAIHPPALMTLARPAAHPPGLMATVQKTEDQRTMRDRVPAAVARTTRPAPVARIPVTEAVTAARPPPMTSHPGAAPTPLDVPGLVSLPG